MLHLSMLTVFSFHSSQWSRQVCHPIFFCATCQTNGLDDQVCRQACTVELMTRHWRCAAGLQPLPDGRSLVCVAITSYDRVAKRRLQSYTLHLALQAHIAQLQVLQVLHM